MSTFSILERIPKQMLEEIDRERNKEEIALLLGELQRLVQDGMSMIEQELDLEINKESLVGRGAAHLLQQRGKRIRSICVILAAALKERAWEKIVSLAVAVELIHHATLLHDDVVDMADTRRGVSTSRVVYGNAVSIFSGDWLLIQALRRVSSYNKPEITDRLFSTIEEMILAESIQLEHRSRFDTNRETYFQIIAGKTASLFRFGMYAGAQLAGFKEEIAGRIAQYGYYLGMAFQLMDDVLDITAKPENLGKAIFADLREGKMTFPFIIAAQNDQNVHQMLTEMIENSTGDPDPASMKRLAFLVERAGGIEETRSLAVHHVERALNCLEVAPVGAARKMLSLIAKGSLHREA